MGSFNIAIAVAAVTWVYTHQTTTPWVKQHPHMVIVDVLGGTLSPEMERSAEAALARQSFDRKLLMAVAWLLWQQTDDDWALKFFDCTEAERKAAEEAMPGLETAFGMMND